MNHQSFVMLFTNKPFSCRSTRALTRSRYHRGLENSATRVLPVRSVRAVEIRGKIASQASRGVERASAEPTGRKTRTVFSTDNRQYVADGRCIAEWRAISSGCGQRRRRGGRAACRVFVVNLRNGMDLALHRGASAEQGLEGGKN